MVLSKEVIRDIKKDQKKISPNNTTTSESPRSAKKLNTSSSFPQKSPSFKPVAKKNLAQQRLKNLTSSLNVESERIQASGSIKRKSEPSENKDIFIPKRQTSSDNNNNASSTPRRSSAINYNSDNSARKIIQSNKISVQDRININHDVFMLDVSGNTTIEETDDKMEWEEIPVEEIVEKVQNVRNNQGTTSMSPIDKLRTSHRNVQHSEDHFYFVIDTNVFLSNLDFIKSIMGKKFHYIGIAVIYVPYMVLNELDKIKSYDDDLARLARRAIKFINDNLKLKNIQFCAQSATEQMEIIQIDCGDDLILNACLQINKITPKVLFLSNDTNLRNKAHANQICSMNKDECVKTTFNSFKAIKFE
ncbi:unnamed protein product [Diamesa serratosioi]